MLPRELHCAVQGVREQLGGRQRRELFSFAAAQMLELGVAERLALLLTQASQSSVHQVSSFGGGGPGGS